MRYFTCSCRFYSFSDIFPKGKKKYNGKNNYRNIARSISQQWPKLAPCVFLAVWIQLGDAGFIPHHMIFYSFLNSSIVEIPSEFDEISVSTSFSRQLKYQALGLSNGNYVLYYQLAALLLPPGIIKLLLRYVVLWKVTRDLSTSPLRVVTYVELYGIGFGFHLLSLMENSMSQMAGTNLHVYCYSTQSGPISYVLRRSWHFNMDLANIARSAETHYRQNIAYSSCFCRENEVSTQQHL